MDVLIVLLSVAHFGALGLLLRAVYRILGRVPQVERAIEEVAGSAREATNVARAAVAAVEQLRADMLPRLEQIEVHPRLAELRRLK